MKWQFLLLILIFLTNSSNLTAQPNLVETIEQIWLADSTKWRNSERTIYQYEDNLLKYQLRSYWFTGRNDWGNKEGITYFYDENDRLEKEIINSYQAGTDNYENLYTNTYTYHTDGCLIAESNEIISIHDVYPQHYYEYTVDENCYITERLWKTLKQNGDTTYKKNSYVYDAEGLMQIDSQYALYNGDWDLHYERLFEYDNEQRLTEKVEFLLFSFSTVNETEIWEYDENGGLRLRIKSRKTNANPYREISKDSILLKYDDQNRVTERRTLSYRFDTPEDPKLETYKYYCDDILKQSKEERLPFIYRTTYEYEVGLAEDCLEELADKTMVIFPNPAMDKLTITSDLLSGERSKIFIYDALGRQFLEQEFFVLHNTLTLDISYLNKGIYFISIENKNRINTAKLYKN